MYATTWLNVVPVISRDRALSVALPFSSGVSRGQHRELVVSGPGVSDVIITQYQFSIEAGPPRGRDGVSPGY
jgi:hypothetical protein